VSGFDPQTLKFYADEAQSYIGHRPDKIDAGIAKFLDRLTPGARILELGCGGGIDAAHMLARGFDVHATDGVAEMAAIAEQRLGRPVSVMRFDKLAAVRDYDAVIANASLLHVPNDGLQAILTRIWTALRPSGWHFATFKTGAPPGYDRHGRYYNYLLRAEAEALYHASGNWGLMEFEEWPGVGYFSEPALWLGTIARKSPD
jgi:SAM-dependent methyltransferase